MIREEALAELKERVACAKYVNEEYADMVDVNALEVAIEALKVEPCEDAISREEMLQTIDRRIGKTVRTRESIEKDSEGKTYIDGLFDAYSRIKKDISKIPSVNSVDESKGSVDERVDDCISRQAAVSACLNGWNKDYKEIVADIKALPSVTPAEKVGHWEWVQYDSNPNIGNWHCSKCRTIIPHTPKETDNTPIYKWCPMCGARMVEPQESEG